MRKIKICLDAGHGLYTAGKRTPAFSDGSTIKEAEQNYPIMFKLGQYLKLNGFDVVYTNSDIKYDMSLKERVDVSNKANADLFISLHKDAITGKWQTTASGIGAYIYKTGGNAEKVAKLIQTKLIKDTGSKDRGIKTDNFYVIKYTNAPAVLLELGFMDYMEEAKQMKDSVWHDRYAKAIANGICEYYNVKFIDADDKNHATVVSNNNNNWKEVAIESLIKQGILTDNKWLDKTNDDDYTPFWADAIIINRLLDRVKQLEEKVNSIVDKIK